MILILLSNQYNHNKTNRFQLSKIFIVILLYFINELEIYKKNNKRMLLQKKMKNY